MTHTDCLQLQRKARRSGRLHGNALMLLAEICEAHTLEKGCIIENETFAERLNCTSRTIRNWIRDLQSEGLIAERKEGGNRVLLPCVPSWMRWKEGSSAESTFQNNAALSGNGVPGRKERSGNQGGEGGKNFPTQRDNYSESASGARAREDRWAFLPSQHRALLPTIKAEAGAPDDNPDVLSIASRHLGKSQSDLTATVDDHLDEHATDEVIAAYVIGGKKGDRPLAYAKHILSMGWKEQGGDGSTRRLPDDQDVIHFGSTR